MSQESKLMTDQSLTVADLKLLLAGKPDTMPVLVRDNWSGMLMPLGKGYADTVCDLQEDLFLESEIANFGGQKPVLKTTQVVMLEMT